MHNIIVLALIATCLSTTVLAQTACCIDPNGVDMPFKAYWGNTVTNADCRGYCSELNYDYAGTQNGNECWCGNAFCSLGKLDASSCYSPCAGNANEKCGGFAINSVYMTNARYIGCYIDADTRDLTYRGPNLDYPGDCITTCRTAGYKYAGVQNSNECWCGNTYGRYGAAPASDCLACSAYNLQTCGAGWRNSVYKA